MSIITHANKATAPSWSEQTEDAAPVGRIHRAVLAVAADDQCSVELQRIDFNEDQGDAPGETVVLLDGQVLSHRGVLRLLTDLRAALQLGWDQQPQTPEDGWLADHLLTAEQAARMLQCSEWTLGDLRRGGTLAGVKVGRAHRYDRQALNAFIARGGRC